MKKLGIFFILAFLSMTGVYFLLFHPTDEFVEGDLYDEILLRGKIRVGINTDSKPFGFTDKNGQIVGYDADLAHYIAKYIVRSSIDGEKTPIDTSERI